MAQAGLLPRIEARADYAALQPDSGLWLPPIRAICQRHGCATDGLVRLGDGTNVVFATADGQVVKLFPPFWALERQVDRAVAERVYGRLGVATPEIRACGELEGWPYLVMSRLNGRYLNQLWDELDGANQLQIASDLGELLARMHALPTEGLPHVRERWAALLRDQPAASMDAIPSHCSGEFEHCVDRIQDGTVPVVFKNPPTAFDWIVLTVIGWIVRQTDCEARLMHELDQAMQELSAPTMIFWSIVQIDHQRRDMGEALMHRLPPLF